ncbi:MAG: type II secretion system protein [Thiobacillus sp.]|nr:type II secretion system protein [Thiobacillus sp.]
MTWPGIRRPSGFTLIELVVTVAIVALLSSMALPMAEVVVKREKENELRAALRQIRTALDDYRQAVQEGRIAHSVDQSGYPETLAVLVDGVPDLASPDQKGRLRFLRRVPRDPFFPDPARSDEETWGKRSYASAPDAPDEGADVFDVYSMATGVGLNGIPYRNW